MRRKVDGCLLQPRSLAYLVLHDETAVACMDCCEGFSERNLQSQFGILAASKRLWAPIQKNWYIWRWTECQNGSVILPLRIHGEWEREIAKGVGMLVFWICSLGAFGNTSEHGAKRTNWRAFWYGGFLFFWFIVKNIICIS